MTTSTMERAAIPVDDGAETRDWIGQPVVTVGDEDWQEVQALRRGDEAAFEVLLNRYHTSMVRRACSYVGNPETAEEVVQDTWIAVLQGIDRFEGRSTLKTWLFNILANRARTRAVREARGVPLSPLGHLSFSGAMPMGGREDSIEATHSRAGAPRNWAQLPEAALLAREIRGRIQQAVAALPASQREVMILRDIEGWSAEEVCTLLDVTYGNQRVLLHRARSSVRRALEPYLDEGK